MAFGSSGIFSGLNGHSFRDDGMRTIHSLIHNEIRAWRAGCGKQHQQCVRDSRTPRNARFDTVNDMPLSPRMPDLEPEFNVEYPDCLNAAAIVRKWCTVLPPNEIFIPAATNIL
jgi:hypothetical protein